MEITPVDFKEANYELVPDESHTDEGNKLSGLCLCVSDNNYVSKWKLSFIDRIKLLFKGSIYLCQYGNHNLCWMRVSKKEVFSDIN